jgi:hypothetical protein
MPTLTSRRDIVRMLGGGAAAAVAHKIGAAENRLLGLIDKGGREMLQAGVTRDTLHGILVDNPRRFLAFVPPYRLNRG